MQDTISRQTLHQELKRLQQQHAQGFQRLQQLEQERAQVLTRLTALAGAIEMLGDLIQRGTNGQGPPPPIEE